VSKSTKESEETRPVTGKEAESPATDGWLSWLLLAIFLLLCLVAWWLVHRSSLRGAPDAPVGMVGAEDPRREKEGPLMVWHGQPAVCCWLPVEERAATRAANDVRQAARATRIRCALLICAACI
jgi:hypothetical protein